MGFMDQIEVTGPVLSVAYNSSASGDTIAVPAVAGKKLEIYRVIVVVTGATTLTFKDGAGTSLTGPMDIGALGSIILDPTSLPWFETSAGNDFIINSSAATKVAGKIDYIVQR